MHRFWYRWLDRAGWTLGGVDWEAMRFTGKTNFLLVGVLFLAGVTGCAPMSRGAGDRLADNASDVSLVKEAAEARWRALIEGKVDEAYDYLSPGTRAVLSSGQYKGRMRLGIWKSAKALSAECVDMQCKVYMEIAYAYASRTARQDIKTVLEENWIKDGGKWWYVPRL